jgi:release factor glutamine methyltransferase
LHALWLLATGRNLSAIIARNIELRELNKQESDQLTKYIARWSSGEPLAHITNRQNFFNYEFIVDNNALIPRKETELLASKAIEKIDASSSAKPTVIDICTGCGNLPIVFKHLHPEADIYAADLSSDAIKLANLNLKFHNLENQIEFKVGDLLSPFEKMGLKGNVDILTCNPPYISSKKISSLDTSISEHEPALAFDGGPFGVTILQRVIGESVEFLAPGGWLIFEVGAGQGEPLLKKLQRSDQYSKVEAVYDDNPQIRVIAAQK